MIFPNTIIAGAPKCGTTSVFDYLAGHPEVCPSNVKETYYLIDKDYPLYRAECNYDRFGLKGYGRFFQESAQGRGTVYLEATPDYMYQHTPLDLLPTFPTIPKVLFILRKPSERVYSLYRFAQQNLAILDKDLLFSDFVTMVECEHASLENRPILRKALQHSRYSIYLQRWYHSIGSAHVHVFIFENLARDPRAFMKSVCGVLNIDATYYDTYKFARKNETVQIGSQTLHRFARRISGYTAKVPLRRQLQAIYCQLNKGKHITGRTDDEIEMLHRLDREFAPHNSELAELTGLNLTRWQ